MTDSMENRTRLFIQQLSTNLQQRGYPKEMINQAILKASQLDRNTLLKNTSPQQDKTEHHTIHNDVQPIQPSYTQNFIYQQTYPVILTGTEISF